MFIPSPFLNMVLVRPPTKVVSCSLSQIVGLSLMKRLVNGGLGQISEPVRAIFESLQPYNRPDPTLPPLLRILRELNNVDKHRLLKLAYEQSRKDTLASKESIRQMDGNSSPS